MIDEIRLHDRALTAEEIRGHFQEPEVVRPAGNAVCEWTFQADGAAVATRPSERWSNAAMDLSLSTAKGTLRQRWELPRDQVWSAPEWCEVSLALDPVSFQTDNSASALSLQCSEVPGGQVRPVIYDAPRGWHCVNLDGLEPIVPLGDGRERQNDAMERLQVVLVNPTEDDQTARLLFEKNGSGIRQRIGSPITGLSAILRYPDGHPTGVPVQLSKNWHGRPAGGVYAGTWFHGFSQVHLPPKVKVELELVIVYGHWGGVAAASSFASTASS